MGPVHYGTHMPWWVCGCKIGCAKFRTERAMSRGVWVSACVNVLSIRHNRLGAVSHAAQRHVARPQHVERRWRQPIASYHLASDDKEPPSLTHRHTTALHCTDIMWARHMIWLHPTSQEGTLSHLRGRHIMVYHPTSYEGTLSHLRRGHIILPSYLTAGQSRAHHATS